ncbi:MAG TPA: hypothetical protein VMB49_04025 [Acidobacteriaceae bacterium]|nr:hypothetical protein [Acidobacteriaceae bacterium]
MWLQGSQLHTKTGIESRIAAPLWLRAGFWICIVIAVAVVIRRLIALASPAQSGPLQMLGLDRTFAAHTGLTLAHILPALAFVILVPLALLPRFSKQLWPERWLFPLGAIVGITAYAMSAYSIGGWVERSAVLFYNSLFLFSLGRAWRYKAQGDLLLKRRWLTRAVGVLLGIATTRPVMGVFFATSSVTHLRPQQFFGLAFWVGFSINWIIVESWIHRQSLAVAAQTMRRAQNVATSGERDCPRYGG